MRKIRDEQLYAAIKEQVREQIRVQKQGAKEAGGNEPSILLKDGKERFRGTYNDCLAKLHQLQPNSWDYAMKWGGWKIVPQKGNESVREAKFKAGDKFTFKELPRQIPHMGMLSPGMSGTVMGLQQTSSGQWGYMIDIRNRGQTIIEISELDRITEARATEGTVHVMNLATQEKKVYTGISPEEAVIAAYAQSKGDYNTWDYQKRYGRKLVRNRLTVTAGDWSAFKDGRPLD